MRGRGGCGRLLNRGTEVQEFHDDIPKAVNQMPETNGQGNTVRGQAATHARTCSSHLTSLLHSFPTDKSELQQLDENSATKQMLVELTGAMISKQNKTKNQPSSSTYNL